MKLAALLVVMIALAAAHAGASSAFPCRFEWALDYGHRVGYVTAGASADCAGRPGSLTIGVRLLRLNPETHSWSAVARRTRTFHDLSRNRFVQVATPCATATFRAVMHWTLRAPGGTIVARHVVHTGKLAVPAPHCSFTLG